MDALKEVLEYFGGAGKTATAFAVDRQLVDTWIKKGFIPYKRGLQTESVTGGIVKAVDVWMCAAKARNH